MILTEGKIKFDFTAALNAKKFDDPTSHQLSVMKAVDFIIEEDSRFLFIEVKDPQNPLANLENASKYLDNFKSGRLQSMLKYKYRDSYLYEVASGNINKNIIYVVIIAHDTLTDADLLMQNDLLKKGLPINGPSGHSWKKFVEGSMIVNLEKWNILFNIYPATRIR